MTSDDRQRVAYAEEVSGVLAGLENAVERETAGAGAKPPRRRD